MKQVEQAFMDGFLSPFLGPQNSELEKALKGRRKSCFAEATGVSRQLLSRSELLVAGTPIKNMLLLCGTLGHDVSSVQCPPAMMYVEGYRRSIESLPNTVTEAIGQPMPRKRLNSNVDLLLAVLIMRRFTEDLRRSYIEKDQAVREKLLTMTVTDGRASIKDQIAAWWSDIAGDIAAAISLSRCLSESRVKRKTFDREYVTYLLEDLKDFIFVVQSVAPHEKYATSIAR